MSDGDFVECPYCEKEQSDCHNGGDPGPWWNGKDDRFKVTCSNCNKKFILETCWSPTFESFTLEDGDE